MAVFLSFHYDRDAHRVQQIMNMGVIDGQAIMNSQDWEAAKKKGKGAVETWINEQMKYKTAVVVLVGAQTASREWVKYEIAKAWDDKRPLVGVRIHGLKNLAEKTDTAGPNPFDNVSLKSGKKVSDYVQLHTPAGGDSKAVYASIQTNLKTWSDGAYKRA